MDFLKELGVQSYCFRGFKDNQTVTEMVKACGLSKIELWRGHGRFEDVEGYSDVIGTYQDAGVDIVSMGQQTFSGDVQTEQRWFEFITQAGAQTITSNFTVESTPESYYKAEALAEIYDVRLGIHSHGGRHWLGTSDMLRYVFDRTSASIGLCLDTAWAIDSREDPIAMAREFADRLYGVHLKDFVYDPSRHPEDVIIGEGNLNLKDFLATLQDIGFDGTFVLEYEGDVDDPVPALKQCVDAVKAALA
jgi:sugar phosphate isomerase/epimerase